MKLDTSFWRFALRSLVFCLFLVLAFGSWASAQPNDDWFSSQISEAYLAKDNGKGKAGDPVNAFITTDIPIHCVVMLNTSETVTVRMNLVAVSVTGVKPLSNVVSTSYTTKPNQNRVNFSGRPEGSWAAGRYRADIFVNNTLAGKLDFEINTPRAGTSSSFAAKETANKVTVRKP